MAFKRLAVAVAVFVILVGGAFTAYYVADYGADSAAQEPAQVTNETISQQVDVWQFVGKATEEHTAGFNESVTVYNSSGVELTKGTDYEWNATRGTIAYRNTANVQDNVNGNITYTYFENTEGVQILSGPIGGITDAIGWLGVLGAGFSLIVLLLAVAALVARAFSGRGGPPRTNR